jgi:hypothetical protein
LLRPILLHSLLAAAILALRLVQNTGGGEAAAITPVFSAADNPAAYLSFTNSSGIREMAPRILTHLYLAAFHVEQLLWPAVLSYDWQMGAVPLVTALADRRNLETAALFLLLGRLAAAEGRRRRRQRSAVLFGLLFLVLPFIPASNLFFRVGFVAAEREVGVDGRVFFFNAYYSFVRILSPYISFFHSLGKVFTLYCGFICRFLGIIYLYLYINEPQTKLNKQA